MVLTDNLMTYLVEVMLSHLALTCALLLASVAAIRRFIRESYRVGGFGQKHVFITGCDSGFGNLLARQLDGKGLHVLAACLSEEGAADLAAATSSRLKTLLLDVTDSESIRRGVQFVSREVGERGEAAGDQTLKKKGHQNVFPLLSRRGMQQFGIKVSIIEPGFFKTAVTSVELIDTDLRRLWTRLPQEVKDSYGETYLEDYVKAQEFSMGILCSPDISKVTRCMEHALTAQFPRTRYSTGWDAKLFWIPLSYLPSFVSDFVVNMLLPSPKG
ncbi:retinol dehydrogenase 5-like [Gymnodraco acuticeps]|uniref:Retinol dehydrogenase 5-like n=1 Tax=Gymnodraco acuticeps TaxID=8218 RepID=A0A6P8T7W2_GYMAC|nr:retinol dehydrogenase 5-like [Gymnodraco acuticeps]